MRRADSWSFCKPLLWRIGCRNTVVFEMNVLCWVTELHHPHYHSATLPAHISHFTAQFKGQPVVFLNRGNHKFFFFWVVVRSNVELVIVMRQKEKVFLLNNIRIIQGCELIWGCGSNEAMANLFIYALLLLFTGHVSSSVHVNQQCHLVCNK